MANAIVKRAAAGETLGLRGNLCNAHINAFIQLCVEGMVRNETIKEALEEEKELETNTYHNEEYGTLKGIMLLVNEGWNKKGSGCTYNSATGTMNGIVRNAL